MLRLENGIFDYPFQHHEIMGVFFKIYLAVMSRVHAGQDSKVPTSPEGVNSKLNL